MVPTPIVATTIKSPPPVGIRRPIRELEKDYYENDKKAELENLMTGFYRLAQLDPDDKNSFFTIGGYHGEPFVNRPDVDSLNDQDRYKYWGGYCQHANILFPTWHRTYLLRIEKALQAMVPEATPAIMLPYWDEVSDQSCAEGLPRSFTDEEFEIPGVGKVANPLKSFKFPVGVKDHPYNSGDFDHYKPAGYVTKRYPLSGLVGTEKARIETEEWNSKFTSDAAVNILNKNVKSWLGTGIPTKYVGKSTSPWSVREKYLNCIDAPNYTVFSNTTTQGVWKSDHPSQADVTALEAPHNDIHLCIGGWHVPGHDHDGPTYTKAKGDMGENNTASFDPIFFFHHCFVDRVFAFWQEQHNFENNLKIIDHFAGTLAITSDSGPSVTQSPGEYLTLDTGLAPFMNENTGKLFTSNDVTNTEKLGYKYADGSLPNLYKENKATKLTAEKGNRYVLQVSGINRTKIQGSFIIQVVAIIEGKEHYVGHQSVLSRHNVRNCANCLATDDIRSQFSLGKLPLSIETPPTIGMFRVDAICRSDESPIDLTSQVDKKILQFEKTAIGSYRLV